MGVRSSGPTPGADVVALESGARGSIADAADVFARALEEWTQQNAWRLDAGASVAWAGEQSGFGEAADADGQLLSWDDSGDDHECEDCLSLASMPPQPLSEWPCQPGDGATACNVGCRCRLSPTGMEIQPGDTYDPALTDAQSATLSKLNDAQAQALADMMPDAAYLN